MNLSLVDSIVRWTAGLLAYAALGILLYGVWRGTRRAVGRTVGLSGGWSRSPWFYLTSSAFFLGLSCVGWIPLPLSICPLLRAWMLVLGSLLYFPGIVFVLWGRLILGKNYFVSSGLGAQLFEGHQLVTSGPFAIVRHPIYSGLILAALDALLIYSTWTTLLFVCFAPLMTIRAYREEKILADEFGEQWWEYCQRVLAYIPKFNVGKRKNQEA